MAQYRPSELIPSTLSSEYSVNPAATNTFTCQINGASPTTKYRLKIMQNNQTSTMVYDSGVVTLATPLYPVDSNGNVNLLSVNVPANTLTGGTEYKWTMTSYWGTTETSDFLESYENVFYAYMEPTVVINNVPNTLTQKAYTFNGLVRTYDGVQIERFGWILMNSDTGEVLVDTINENNIYSSQVQLYYDGFFTNNNYIVRLKCWFSNGISKDTGDFYDFNVQYDTIDTEGLVTGYNTCDGGVLIEWPGISFIPGTATDTVIEQNEKVNGYVANISSDGSIVFDKINSVDMVIPGSSTVVISFFASPTDGTTTLFEAKTKETASNGLPMYSFGLEMTATALQIFMKQAVGESNPTQKKVTQKIYDIGADDKWYVVKFSPDGATVIADAYDDNGLFPEEDLYLSDSLLPDDGTRSNHISSTAFAGQFNLLNNVIWGSVSLFGQQVVNYLWMFTNPMSETQFSQYQDYTLEPDWTPDTELLALFNTGFEGGNISSQSGGLTGWIIYRQNPLSSHLTLVDKTAKDKQWIVDYRVSNQNTYTYFIFPEFGGTIGAPIISDQITTNWWEWYLLVCNDGEDSEEYYVDDVFKFDLDVSTTAMSNNTTFNVLQNFTAYPKIQRSNSNYWSGSISALLGNCNIDYQDTIERMNELKELSTDIRTKFLKDRKGNMWRVSISNPIGEQMNDVFKEQQVTITLNWIEVGPMGDAKIVQSPSVNKSTIQICDRNYLNGG